MEVLVAPVSGGSFPHQLASMRLLCSMRYRPELALGSSGGNLTIYLTMAAHWDSNSINRVVRSLDSKYLVQSWFPSVVSFLPSIIAGIFTGAAYRTSKDIYKVFETYFTPESITETEIWNGAINRDTGAVCLFCNRSRETAHIKGDRYRERMFKSLPLHYLNGDMKDICLSSVASSAVPLVLEAQTYNGASYIDGGTKFASPLVPLQDELRYMSAERGGIHITYVNGYNVEEDYSHNKIPVDIVSNGMSVTAHVVRGLVLHDRMTAYELIHGSCGQTSHYADLNDVNAIRAIYPLLKFTSSSLLEIYPKYTGNIDYTNFTGDQIIEQMNRSEVQLAGHLWWIGKSEIFRNIPGVVYGTEEDHCGIQPRCQI